MGQPLVTHFSTFPSYTPITMPALSPTMEDGAISSWVKEEGDEVKAGDAICEIETDKATVDFELADDGFLAKILAEPNSRIKVGDIIGILVEDSENVAAFANAKLEDFASNTVKEVKKEEVVAPIVSEKTPSPPTVNEQNTQVKGDRIFITPYARKTARENGIDIESLRGRGSGPNGRVKQQDVVDFIAAIPSTESAEKATPSPVTQSSASFYDLALENRALANNLEQSKKEVPHYFLVTEVELTEILKLREHFKSKYEIDISVNDFIIKASTVAMKTVPMANASFRKDFIRIFNSVDINLFTNNGLGLIKGCQSKGLVEIAEASRTILEEESDKLDIGTFSVINLGMYGVSKAYPIVVHGQSVCLGVGEVTQEYIPVQRPDSDQLDFKQVDVVNISLSCDHRVVDGAVGAKWLQQFKKLMEDPSSLLL